MNGLMIAFIVANTAACAVTCWYALCGLNACTTKTPFSVRMSFAGISTGAFAAMLHPPEPDLGGMGAVLVFLGVAVGFLANRRQCVCLNCPSRGGKRTPAPMDNFNGRHPA